MKPWLEPFKSPWKRMSNENVIPPIVRIAWFADAISTVADTISTFG